jgi:hypothetical protein
MPASVTLVDIDPQEVARQLTLLMWAHFEKLSESDFLDLACVMLWQQELQRHVVREHAICCMSCEATV